MRLRSIGTIAPLALFTATLAYHGVAAAHFVLQSPPAAFQQDGYGDPQKFAPCGPGGAGTPTGEVTTVQAGDTITVTIDETIYHPGHYRVALALNDPNELPPAPQVTPVGNDQCGSTTIENPPVFPVLADGIFAHNSAFGGPQTLEITIPEDVECENCTLQVIQYMSSHGAPCFYYHCANIQVQGLPVDPTTGPGDDTTGGDPSTGGMMTTSPMTTTPDPDSNGDDAETSEPVGEESETANSNATINPPGDTDAQAGDDDKGGCGCTSDHGERNRALAGLVVLVALGARRRR